MIKQCPDLCVFVSQATMLIGACPGGGGMLCTLPSNRADLSANHIHVKHIGKNDFAIGESTEQGTPEHHVR